MIIIKISIMLLRQSERVCENETSGKKKRKKEREKEFAA